MTERCGFVTVIGAPNAGKSTLVNALVGEKVSIVSSKVQTTRMPVRGIAVHGESQIIFIDTPGIFTPHKKLERAMVASAQESREGADVVMLVIDASKEKMDENTRSIVSGMGGEEGPLFLLALNKVDRIRPEKLLPIAQEINDLCAFDATFMISALKGIGTDDILKWLADRIPEGPWHYSTDVFSDMPLRLLMAEITREKLFENLHKELPYGLAVVTERWDDDGKIIQADQVVFAARESHRPIVLGKGGSMIKAIGTEARREMEDILGRRVHLKIFVKVEENWANDPEYYRSIGLDMPK